VKIEVRFFASLADRAGSTCETIEIAPGESVAGLWDLLLRRHPDLAAMNYRPMVACDMEYADWEETLDGVREVAFLPPVSGG
jgi:molybdopterin synthase sulfur carrier subunit